MFARFIEEVEFNFIILYKRQRLVYIEQNGRQSKLFLMGKSWMRINPK